MNPAAKATIFLARTVIVTELIVSPALMVALVLSTAYCCTVPLVVELLMYEVSASSGEATALTLSVPAPNVQLLGVLVALIAKISVAT
jgi:hypothetical protein